MREATAMSIQVGELDDDITNVEAWAEIIKDLLHLMPPEQRADVLALAVKNEEANRKEREADGGRWFKPVNLTNMDTNPGIRHWNAIMRLKSLIVQGRGLPHTPPCQMCHWFFKKVLIAN
jgi:hypothetical protein